MANKFNPREMHVLEAPNRREWMPPERILAALDLQPGKVLADIGCGPGFFAVPAARVVGRSGKVYCIDISLDMLMRVGQHKYNEGLSQLETILSKETNIPLADGVADAVLLANVLHEAEDLRALLTEACRLAKEGGRLLVAEWRKVPTPMGPRLEERLEPGPVREIAETAGWLFSGEWEIGPYHWGLVFVKGGAEGR